MCQLVWSVLGFMWLTLWGCQHYFCISFFFFFENALVLISFSFFFSQFWFWRSQRMFFWLKYMNVNEKEFKPLLMKFWKLKNCLRFECVNLMIHFSNVQICLFSKIFVVNVQFILFLREITLWPTFMFPSLVILTLWNWLWSCQMGRQLKSSVVWYSMEKIVLFL